MRKHYTLLLMIFTMSIVNIAWGGENTPPAEADPHVQIDEENNYRELLYQLKTENESSLFPHLDNTGENMTTVPKEEACNVYDLSPERCAMLPHGIYPMNSWQVFTPTYGRIYKMTMNRRVLKSLQLAQGWKLHISATPATAWLIVQTIFSDLRDAMVRHQIEFKLVPSLAVLNALNNLPEAFIDVPEERENVTAAIANGTYVNTQAGKFITIYTRDAKVAKNLILKLDQKLAQLKQEFNLDEHAYVPIVGDAQVGESGFIYVRYGSYESSYVDEVDPTGQKIQKTTGPARGKNKKSREKILKKMRPEIRERLKQEAKSHTMRILDDRDHPWPNFMNKNNQLWIDADNPLGEEVNMRWVAPNGNIYTWENRPHHWKSRLQRRKAFHKP